MLRLRNKPVFKIIGSSQGRLRLAHSAHAIQQEFPPRLAPGVASRKTSIQLSQDVISPNEEPAGVVKRLGFLCGPDNLLLVKTVWSSCCQRLLYNPQCMYTYETFSPRWPSVNPCSDEFCARVAATVPICGATDGSDR